MLSYQHEYHAGNHADVLKHICLTLILQSLCRKEKPFTVIDSHAGAGRFRLDDERLLRTEEAAGGILRLQEQDAAAPQCVQDYLAAEAPYLSHRLYAGSPELTRLYLRKGDRHVTVEKHPQAAAALRENMALPLLTADGEQPAAARTELHEEDSYTALHALTPPQVKRGLVLCDPSYEDASDYRQVTETLKLVHRKWNTAIIALWYPLIVRRKNETAQMLTALQDDAKLGTMPAESFRCELSVRAPESMNTEAGAHLYGSGMLVINPPWHLQEELEAAAQYLHGCLAQK